MKHWSEGLGSGRLLFLRERSDVLYYTPISSKVERQSESGIPMNEKLTVTLESGKKGFEGGCTFSANRKPVENSWVPKGFGRREQGASGSEIVETGD